MPQTRTAELLDPSWRSDVNSALQPPPLVGDFGDAPAEYDQILARVLAEARDWPWRPELEPIELVARTGDALRRLGAELPDGLLLGGFTGPIMLAMALPGIGVRDWTQMGFSRIPAGVDPDAEPLADYISARAMWAASAAGFSDSQCWLMLYALAAREAIELRDDVIGSLVRAASLVPPLDRTRWLDTRVAAAFGRRAVSTRPRDLRTLVGAAPDFLIRTEEAMGALDAAVARVADGPEESVTPTAARRARFTYLLGWRITTSGLRNWLTGVDREPPFAVALGAALARYGYEVAPNGAIERSSGWAPAHTTPTACTLVASIVRAKELFNNPYLDGLTAQRRLRDRIASEITAGRPRDGAGDVVAASDDRVTAIFDSYRAALERARALLLFERDPEMRQLTNGQALKLRLAIGTKGEVFRTTAGCEGLAVILAQRLCSPASSASAVRRPGEVLMPSELADEAVGLGFKVGPERTRFLALAELPELAVRTAWLPSQLAAGSAWRASQ